MAKENDAAAFDQHLSHMFPVVHQQVDVGLYCVKRIPNFLEKVALLNLTFAQDLQKITAHELNKSDRTQQDQALQHVFGYHKIQHVVGYMASQFTQFSHRLLAEVIEPLTQCHADAIKKKDKIVERERRYSADIKQVEHEVVEHRVTCLKLWRALQDMQRERDDLDAKVRVDGKKKSKLDEAQSALVKQQTKTIAEFKRFEDHLAAATMQETEYHTHLMPSLLNELEALERQRLVAMEKHLGDFARLFREMFEPFGQYSAALERDIAQMNAEQSMRTFTQGLVANFGEPPPPPVLASELPADSSTLGAADADKLKELLTVDCSNLLESHGIPASATSESVFGQFSSFLGFKSDAAANKKSGAAVSSASPSGGSGGGGGTSDDASSDAAAKATNALRNLKIPDEDPAGCDIVRATFDFEGKEIDDVDFKIHDLIRVLSKPDDTSEENIKNGEWWIGRVLCSRIVTRRADGRMERVFVDGTFPSNYVETLTIGPSIGLRHLLELRGGRFLFHEFLKSEYSQENLDFWVRVEDFRTRALSVELAIEQSIAEFGSEAAVAVNARLQLEPIHAQARLIYSTFVSPSAPDQININSTNRKTVTDRIEALGTPAAMATATSGGGAKDSDVFDAAQVEIFRLLSSDSFMRFKKSPFWFRMLKHYERK